MHLELQTKAKLQHVTLGKVLLVKETSPLH